MAPATERLGEFNAYAHDCQTKNHTPSVRWVGPQTRDGKRRKTQCVLRLIPKVQPLRQLLHWDQRQHQSTHQQTPKNHAPQQWRERKQFL